MGENKKSVEDGEILCWLALILILVDILHNYMDNYQWILLDNPWEKLVESDVMDDVIEVYLVSLFFAPWFLFLLYPCPFTIFMSHFTYLHVIAAPWSYWAMLGLTLMILGLCAKFSHRLIHRKFFCDRLSGFSSVNLLDIYYPLPHHILVC